MAVTATTTAINNAAMSNFDIVSHFKELLATDPSLTPPIAAIESLISLLSSSPITTVSETLSLLSHASGTLLKSQRNPIPVSAGSDLFQRYLMTSFQNTPLPSQSGSDFTQLRNQLITNGKVFVARAKSARAKIASHALPLIKDESVVVTYGTSRVVSSLLAHAVDAGRWFRVVQVVPSNVTGIDGSGGSGGDGGGRGRPEPGNGTNKLSGRLTAQIADLRKAGIQVATVPITALSYVFHSLPETINTSSSPSSSSSSSSANVMVILGTSAVLENGATVSQMGSYLVSQIARLHHLPLYVATESYKFARQFPVGYGAQDLEDMGTKQDVLNFTTSSPSTFPSALDGNSGGTGDTETSSKRDKGEESEQQENQLVDITPPGLISGLITENGVMTPNAVAEELIKLWY